MRSLVSRIALTALLVPAVLRGGEAASLGTVFRGEETAFQLPFTNHGKGAIWVVDAVSSCDCLVGRFKPLQVTPGETAQLPFAYRSATTGRISVSVQVRGAEGSTVLGAYAVTGFVADQAWLLAAAELSGRAADFVVVDVRSADRYAQAHIPRALNLPGFALKSRRDLKARPLVLIDDGCAPGLLLEQAAALRLQGFPRVFVLDGGMAGWMRGGGKAEGTSPGVLAVASIAAAEYVRTQADCDWRIIEIAPRPASGAGPVQAPGIDRWENLPSLLRAMPPAAPGRLPPRILVIAPDPATCARIESRFGGKSPVPFYYLADGRAALDALMAERAALATGSNRIVQVRPERGMPVRAGGCNTCPHRN